MISVVDVPIGAIEAKEIVAKEKDNIRIFAASIISKDSANEFHGIFPYFTRFKYDLCRWANRNPKKYLEFVESVHRLLHAHYQNFVEEIFIEESVEEFVDNQTLLIAWHVILDEYCVEKYKLLPEPTSISKDNAMQQFSTANISHAKAQEIVSSVSPEIKAYICEIVGTGFPPEPYRSPSKYSNAFEFTLGQWFIKNREKAEDLIRLVIAYQFAKNARQSITIEKIQDTKSVVTANLIFNLLWVDDFAVYATECYRINEGRANLPELLSQVLGGRAQN